MENNIKVLITGGAGFIGGALIRKLLKESNYNIFNLDNLSYSGDLQSIDSLIQSLGKNAQKRYKFIKGDISNKETVENVIQETKPELIFHLAAETHVDKSIICPENFILSNILGTFNLLESSLNYYKKIDPEKQKKFKFIHISTDEVFGSLPQNGFFNENTKYDPRSPYSASKASSDHLVKAWFHTYGLPCIITNCSNNYGPWQYPEKLIPNIISKAIQQKNISIYGSGKNIRDWLYVDDHVEALLLIAEKGKIGSSYCVGGFGERTNKEVQLLICKILDEIDPKKFPHSRLIKNVIDRPGHDKRYAINSTKIQQELDWKPQIKFEDGLKKTIYWYLNNLEWAKKMMEKSGYSGDRIGF